MPGWFGALFSMFARLTEGGGGLNKLFGNHDVSFFLRTFLNILVSLKIQESILCGDLASWTA